ncbi:transmembrane protein 252-like [Scomber scombrus]|uniref:Transmembrane protein 252-like n=1 Tax=Scomber scombrus TaxID=13677 RepID=A0AAV1MVP2_SCOSC
MNVKKHICSLARMVLPGMGFALICMGAYLVSMENDPENTWSVIPSYIMIVTGFLVVLVGVFWTLCHSIKSKRYQRGRHQQHIQVYTIERPSSFPPSYEESEGSHVSLDKAPEFVVVSEGRVHVVINVAPPLYSQDSSEVPDCTWSWEQPPPYSQVAHMLQEQVDAEEQMATLSGR